jgi:hypothetical protein
MIIILILRNGKRIQMRGLSPEYLGLLVEMRCIAGYVLSPPNDWEMRWPAK